MAETPETRVWIGRATWLALVTLFVFLHLLPIETRPRVWAPPDAILAVTLVWAVRRPDYLPVGLVAAVFLLTDLLFHRPPGLWAGLVVMLTEWLRRRAVSLRSLPFPVEWMTVAVGIAAITVGYRLALILTVSPRPPLTPVAVEAVLTVLAYPLAVGLAHLFFGIRRPRPGEVDSLGHRI